MCCVTQQTSQARATGLFTLLKPAPFKSVKDGDPEALLQDFFMDPNIKPTQQKQRKVALHFIPRLKKHLEELEAVGMVSGPLKSEDATGWVSNPVLTAKKWDEQAVRVNLDLRKHGEGGQTHTLSHAHI